VETLLARSASGYLQPSNGASKEELVLYEDLALYLTYYRIWPDLLEADPQH